MQKRDYALTTIIDVFYNCNPIKLERIEFYMDGVLHSIHYYEVGKVFEQYYQCVKCGAWLKRADSHFFFGRNYRVGRVEDKGVCSNCYPQVKEEMRKAETLLYHHKLTKGYLDELLFTNTRMVKNSDYETDSAFFNNYEYCFLTGIKSEGYGATKTVHLDHFIAIDTGHVGRIIGNLYPLSSKLNISKSNKNPFEWIKEDTVANQISPDKWNKLIGYFAHCYDLTVEQYKDFVYWCYANPRRIKDIEKDGDITSLELWKRSKSNTYLG